MAKKKRLGPSNRSGLKAGLTAAAKKAAAAKAAPAAAAAVPPPPPAPARVEGFWNGDDLAAINDFTTRYATDLTNIDFGLGTLKSDTDYQKTQTDTQAKEQTAGTQDDMAARGLFRSSVKDAALYDVEASRALQTKFLDDKMTSATLNAGTQKKILGDSKKRFDEAMVARKTENATAVNDSLSSAWADQMAAYTQANPTPAAAAAPAKPAAAAPAKPTGTTAAKVPGSGRIGGGAAALGKPINTAQGTGSTGKYRWPDGKMHSKPYRGN